jgi:hypothetical protein
MRGEGAIGNRGRSSAHGPRSTVSSLERMSSKSERRAAQETVAAYHEAELAGLIEYVGGAIDRFRGGELDAFDVDRVIFQFSRAAKELWKFLQLLRRRVCRPGDLRAGPHRLVGTGSAAPALSHSSNHSAPPTTYHRQMDLISAFVLRARRVEAHSLIENEASCELRAASC